MGAEDKPVLFLKLKGECCTPVQSADGEVMLSDITMQRKVHVSGRRLKYLESRYLTYISSDVLPIAMLLKCIAQNHISDVEIHPMQANTKFSFVVL